LRKATDSRFVSVGPS